jgi:cytochrome b6-f complex iron-sulfur subunit
MSEDRLDQALDKVLANESPRGELFGLEPEEQKMLRMAQLLHGSKPESVRPEFVDRLHDELFPPPKKVSRRTAFISGMGALAAGVLAGIGLDRVKSNSKPAYTALVGWHGKWVPVATVADVQPGAVHGFRAGAIQGFLINQGGQYRALSRICTHMGCSLNFKKDARRQGFVCPCHGAEFDMSGDLIYGVGGYNSLPSLPKLDVRVKGEAVEVRVV